MTTNEQDDRLAECLLDESESFLNNNNNSSNGNEWPSVYDEVKDMLSSAILMYGVVDLRTLARSQTRSDRFDQDRSMEKLLSLPVSARDIASLLSKHEGAIEDEIGRKSTDLYLDAFDAIEEQSSTARNQSQESEQELKLTASGKISLVPVSFDVVVVDDEKQESELVYAICLDTARKRITVLFRGCSTTMDWTICANNYLNERDNPLYQQPQLDRDTNNTAQEQPEKIAIHQGYCTYLFRINPTTNASKFDSIVRHVRSLLQQHEGYRVYVTGHSLGAAMATVFAFQAAATQKLGLITCIHFASPMVGNLAFETAFRTLEAQGRIRCLRVSNHFDIFTQLPDRGNWLYVFACCWGFHLIAYLGWTMMFFLCFQENVYRHVGMDLHMYRSRSPAYRRLLFFCRQQNESVTYKIKHSRGTPHNFVWRVTRDWRMHFKQTFQRLLAVPFENFKTNHSLKEHLTRLTQLSVPLKKMHLKELYDTYHRHRSPSSDSNSGGDANASPFQSGDDYQVIV